MSQSIASRNVLNIQKKEAIGRENSVPLRHLARLRESGMMQDEKTVRYIGELSGIEETQNPQLQRHLSFSTPLIWLKRGWSDMVTQPLPSLAYGVAVFALSAISVWILVRYGRDYLLFPVLSGLLIVAPFLRPVSISRAGTSLKRNLFPWRRWSACSLEPARRFSSQECFSAC